MRIRSHAGLLAVLGLSVGGLTALALSVSAGAASGQVCLGVVVQDGSAAAPSVQAANVDSGTSDLQAMSAAGDVPTQNNSGLVCAINNFPADGLDKCLDAKGGKFFYWSYWQGNPDTNTWTYASVGPASHEVSAGTDYVEGWRYQDPGADNPTAPSPTMTPAAAFAQACTTTTTTTSGGGGGSSGGGFGLGGPAPSTAPTTSPTQPTAAAASGIMPQTSGPASTTTTNPRGLGGPAPPSAPACSSTTTTSTTAVRAGSHQKTRAPSTAPTTTVPTTQPTTAVASGIVPQTSAPASTTTTNTKGLAGPAPASAPACSSTTTISTVVRAEPHQKNSTSAAKLAEADTSAHGQGGGDPALPIIIVAVVILVLGGVSWFLWRRRPAEE